MKHKGLIVYHFKNKSEFTNWLKSNWKQRESVWLKLAKKDSAEKSPSYEEAREVAICYGWIDGLINKWDGDFYLLKFSKRRPRSQWSKINRDIATNLIQQKKMCASGLAEVDRAKADGRWTAAYDSPKNMTVPKWFVDMVKQHKTAYEKFKTLKKSELYTIAYNLRGAKKEETKERRVKKFLTELKTRTEK